MRCGSATLQGLFVSDLLPRKTLGFSISQGLSLLGTLLFIDGRQGQDALASR
jgi:hypothetical protein